MKTVLKVFVDMCVVAVFVTAAHFLFRREYVVGMGIIAAVLCRTAMEWWKRRHDVQFSLSELLILFFTFQLSIALVLNAGRDGDISHTGAVYAILWFVCIGFWHDRKLAARELARQQRLSRENREASEINSDGI